MYFITIAFLFCARIIVGLGLTTTGINYSNYSLFITTPRDVDQLKFLQNLEVTKYLKVIYWQRPTKVYYDVHLLIHYLDEGLFVERAKHYNLNVKKTVENIQEAFTKQTVRKYVRMRENSFNWNNYHTIEDIYQWLNDMSEKYSSAVELISIGKSVEGRDIYAMAFRNGVKKNAIIEAGVHGHEWMAVEFALFFIDKLLQKTAFRMTRKVNWYIVPVANPDGFAYSHNTDRLWRKNRRPVGKEFGVDLNRNFDYNFRAFSASGDPKDDEYSGGTPFSEPETQALKDFIIALKKNLRYYFSFHAYGQSIILPYGDRVKHIEDYSQMVNYAQQAVMRIYSDTHSKYTVGTVYDTLGTRISGNSASWVKRNFRVRYVMTFLLRDNGTYGHALPADQIIPACNEAMTGLQVVMTAQPRRMPANLYGSAAVKDTWSVYALVVFVLILIKL